MNRQMLRGRRGKWRRAVIACLLVVPCAAVLWVPSYAAGTPRFGGLPLFYWYMVAWLLITPAFMVIAYILLRRQPSGG
ncbi:MAG: DUF3311 domain-containing protein [Pseudonocardiaceae bacterium]